MKIQDAIKKVITGTDLSISEATAVFSEIMSGNATDAQIAALIVAMRIKGESVEEITGAASVMREKATRITPAQNPKLSILVEPVEMGVIHSTYLQLQHL